MHPTPFNPQTTLTLTLAAPQTVRVDVYDVAGRLVRTLHNGPLSAAVAHRFLFDADVLPSGLYLYRIVGEHFSDTRQALLVK